MSRSFKPLSILAAAAVLATGCSGGGRAPATPATAQPAVVPTATGAAIQSKNFSYDTTAVAESTLVGPATFTTGSFDVLLKLRDEPGLNAYAAQVSDPASPNYRHFLSPDQIADRFAASVSDRNAAMAYLQAHHLSAFGWRERMMLAVSGKRSDLEAAFATKFGTYRSPAGLTFVAPMTAPSLPTNVPITGSGDIVRRPGALSRPFSPAVGQSIGYSPQQVATAFDFDGAYAAGFTGKGITIGIVGTGPIQTQTGGRIGDFEQFRKTFNVPGSSDVALVSTSSSDTIASGDNAGYSTPPPTTGSCNSDDLTVCNPEDGEAQLDTEQAASLAKDAHVEFYLAYNGNNACGGTTGSTCAPGTGTQTEGIQDYTEELQTIIDHDTADVVSVSIGSSEFQKNDVNLYQPAPDEFAMLASEGVAIFVASGDNGVNTCQVRTFEGLSQHDCVSYPATDPSVVAVGGITVPLDAGGDFVGPVTAWGLQTTMGYGGTAGGVSTDFTQPAFQMGLPSIIGSTRNVPDVALEGDTSTGVATLLDADPSLGGESIPPIGGTSVAAPEMAAMWATVLQACKQTAACVAQGSGPVPYRLGNPNPTFYKIYGNATAYGNTFLPVFYGNNGVAIYCYYNQQNTRLCPTPAPGTSATPQPVPIPIESGYAANPGGGYNQLTGIGVPFARALIKTVVGV